MNEPKSFDEALEQVLKEMGTVLKQKNKDYGPFNILETGIQGVLIRASDKMSRLKNLYGVTDGSWQPKQGHYESIQDTWLDLANYAIIAQLLLKNAWGLPHKEDLVDPKIGERDPDALMRAEIEMLKERGEH